MLYFMVKTGIGKVRPAGLIRPVSSVNLACSGSSVLTLNSADVLPPNEPKDERLFSRRAGFTLIVDADWLSCTH